MAQLAAEQIQRIVDACRANLAEVPKTFRANFDCEITLSAAAPAVYSVDKLAGFEIPGLAVWLVVGEQAVLILIPESLPLPAWYSEAQISEDDRLQSFARELSMQFLPKDLPAKRYAAIASASLKESTQRTQIGDSAKSIELTAARGDGSGTRVLVIVPTDVPSLPAQNQTAIPPQAATVPDAENAAPAHVVNDLPDASPSDDAVADRSPADETLADNGTSSEPVADRSSPAEGSAEISGAEPIVETTIHHATTSSRHVTDAADEAQRSERLLRVPVTVSVLLAERRVPLGQVVGLVPGSLVTFNKSCEDLLDLFVNNHRYCQGEAVKIGEHFGLKIVRVGVVEERREHVL